MDLIPHTPILNFRPRPIDGESWPGYLVRLAEANWLWGLEDLSRILGINIVKLIVADPDELLLRLGVPWSSHSQSELATGALVRPRYKRLNQQRAGRSLRSRVCPRCLAADSIKHIRAYWDHPVSLFCREHDVLLLDKCQSCGAAISHERAHIDRCDCGASFLQFTTTRCPDWAMQFSRVFASAFTSQDEITFSRANQQASRAAYIAQKLGVAFSPNWLDRRIPVTFLTQENAQLFGNWLSNWPQSVADLFRGDAFQFGSARHKRLNTMLCTSDFPALEELTNWIAGELSIALSSASLA